MPSSFVYDVCLSCSSKDITTVRPIAERLRKAGLQVWFDEGGRKSREGIAARIEQGLEQSRVLVLCISANAMGPEWPHLEAGSLRFRDPLNKERRFIPLRLDDAPLQGTAAQLVCLPWRGEQGEPQYGKLLDACGSPPKEGDRGKEFDAADEVLEKVIQLDCQGVSINAYFFSADRRRVLTGSDDKMVRLWDAESGSCLAALEGHTAEIWSVAWSPDRLHVLTGSSDGTVRLWNLEEGICVRILEGHRDWVYCVAWSPDGRRALSASRDNDIRLWDVATGQPLRVLEGHKGTSWVVAWSPDGSRALSGSADHTARLWDVETGRCLRVFEGHTDYVLSVAWSADQRQALTAAHDNTIRLWELETGKCLRVLEAHTNVVRSVAWGPDQRRALSGGRDNTVRLWDVASGRCLSVLAGHTNNVVAVAWSADGSGALSGDTKGEMRAWDLTPWGPEPSTSRAEPAGLALGPDQVQYTNAKVLLVGESGAGKTGLSKRLASGSWEPSESTIGAWATQWKLPVSPGHGVEREIWLWDFGGQADQRLIHQLYMDETALAILVFDGQKEDLLEMLGQWDRDLTRASRQEYAKLLVAGRVDAGGLRVSRSDVEKFAAERKFAGFLETSARTNQGCEELKQAVLNAIKWDEIPCRTTQVLFKRLKEEIIRLKDEGHVLMRFNELRERLHLRLSGELKPFRDDELRTVLKLLAGPCVVWELAFGGWVLLQPERINAYAQAVIRTLQTDQQQRGCLLEERVLHGDLAYEASMPRLGGGDERRFVNCSQPSDAGGTRLVPPPADELGQSPHLSQLLPLRAPGAGQVSGRAGQLPVHRLPRRDLCDVGRAIAPQ
ncbi:MAG: TIR domain-containing protein [Verrucomicrobiota bacterium]